MQNYKIYIGRNAGSELLEDMHNAKESVKIISPYLSPEYIRDLIGIQEKGVNVSLITSDNIETNNRVDFSHRDIIIQHCHTDELAFQERKVLLNYTMISAALTLITFILGLFTSLFLFFLTLVFFISSSILYLMYANKVVYTYTYSPLFDFKVFFSQYSSEEFKNDFLIHSKLYIIDDKIAYMGSVNYTYSGLVNSFECLTRLNDLKDIEYLNQEYKKLFYNKRLHFKDIEQWGRELYDEPIN